MHVNVEFGILYGNRAPEIDSLGDSTTDVSQMSRRQNLPQVDLHWISRHAGMLSELRFEV